MVDDGLGAVDLAEALGHLKKHLVGRVWLETAEVNIWYEFRVSLEHVINGKTGTHW